jgi:DUF4097 and DUF4098 domain-containing protein YvlB
MKKLFFTTLLALIVTGCEKESNADSGGVTLGTFTGDLNINSQSSLDAAITEGTYINAIGGNLVVSTGGSTGLTVGDVEYISSQINSVGGDVTINTPDGSLDLSELISVGGNYSIQGSDADDDKLLTVDGDITLNYEGDYSMPNLTSAGRIFITPIGTSTASKKTKKIGWALSFPSVARALKIAAAAAESAAAATGNAAAAGSAVTAAGSAAATAGSAAATAGSAAATAGSAAAGSLDLSSFILNPIASIDLGPGLIIQELIAPVAIEIVLKSPEPLAKLNISAPLAKKVEIATKAVNGPVAIQTSTATGSTFSAPALATVQGDVAITCGSADLNNLTVIQGNCAVTATAAIAAPSIASVAGNLTITSVGVSMPILTTVGGNVSVTGTSSNSIVDFANLSNVGGETEIEADDVNLNTGQPHNSGGNG